MKVLQVITSLGFGGAEHLVVQLTQQFQQKGVEVDICVFNGFASSLMTELESFGCVVYRLGKSFYNPLYILKLSHIMKNYDIIHSHNSSPQLYVALANRNSNAKLVTTEHNTDNRKRHIAFLRGLEMWMYRKYERIICISKETELNLRDYLGKKWQKRNGNDRIVTISNGINIRIFREALPIYNKDGYFVLVMVAAFRRQKDHLTLLKAMNYLPNGYRLWLVGDGEQRLSIEKEIDRLGIQERVCLWGNRTDVPEIVKSSDVVIMSSHWEGFGLAAVEGMAAGKPVIASDVDGLKQIVDGYGVLFPHGDYEALAKEIRHLAEDKEFAAEVAKKCQQRATEFDISVMAEKYNQVYLELMQGKKDAELELLTEKRH